ncbi:MAG: methylenetetrahydrofolate reductase [NAD(P)H] [Chloroflexota bacterium]|jgi:methylenetetrahydrofolate reductase (NADPH)
MKVSTLFQEKTTTFSFEFFPPRTPESSNELFNNIRDLVPLEPSYVSITYGAGGSTRELTHDLVVRLQNETCLVVVAHITCVNSTKDEILAILQKYHDKGIMNVMALRGDPPKGQPPFIPTDGGFRYASELVTFIRQHFPDMCIGVAAYPEGHPEVYNRLKEIEYLKAKVDCGTDYICTQLFFENRDFYDFCERCELAGIHVPIIAGIMPITSRKNMLRMADLAAGAHYPGRLLKALSRVEDDKGFERVGIHWATAQVLDLLDKGVKGIHFYTMNKSLATVSVYESLGVSKSSSLT